MSFLPGDFIYLFQRILYPINLEVAMSTVSRYAGIFISFCLIAACARETPQTHEDHPAPERLGRVHFMTSCSTGDTSGRAELEEARTFVQTSG